MSETRILIVDDHEVVREGLRTLLDRRADFTVVGEAGTVAASISEAERTRPDVIVMDVRLPDGSGIEACREIRQARPETKVIMLTSFADDEAVFASILAGAAGYLLKQTRGSQLADAIAAVARGESLLDPAVTRKVMERVRTAGQRKDDDPLSSLTEQEHKILTLIADGKTNKEIADEVYLSDKTVKNYVSNILSKLNLRRRSEAAAYIARREPPHGGSS
ncbi:MAG TPA: response regulator transcription factor [Dehalococcoidia bacterium]|jgi:two-component system response regulator DevR|nr:response regulator transcription factor [Dehalococcoidia bacterium]